MPCLVSFSKSVISVSQQHMCTQTRAHTHTHHPVSLAARALRYRMPRCCWKSFLLSECKAAWYSCLLFYSRQLSICWLLSLLFEFRFFLVVPLHKIWVGSFPVIPQLATRTQSGGLCGPCILKRVSELPTLESVHFFRLIKRWQNHTNSHHDKPPLFPATVLPNKMVEVGRKRWRISGDVGLVGNGSGPHKKQEDFLRKERIFPRKSLINTGHVCRRRKTSAVLPGGITAWAADLLTCSSACVRFEKSAGEKLSRSSVWVTWIPLKVAGLESCLFAHPPMKPDSWVRRAQHLETIGCSTAVMEGDMEGCWFFHVREVESSWSLRKLDSLPIREPHLQSFLERLSAAG